MRLCSVWLPDEQKAALCEVGTDGLLLAVGDPGSFADVADLLASTQAGSLEGAVEGVSSTRTGVGSWTDVEGAEPDPARLHLLAPVRPAEVWAAGVTYERSRVARKLESVEEEVYDRVYVADRPELFFKATRERVVGPDHPVGLRSDSSWQVPEPEVGLVLGAEKRVVGYTLGNDMSTRDIEGENPLYLSQAKIFAGSCALGPVVVSASEIPDPDRIDIRMRIIRSGVVFEGRSSTARLHVKIENLIRYLARDNWLAPGTVLLTGTGIIPVERFSLERGDRIEISSASIGTLTNVCEPAATLPAPPGWSGATD